ncbi:MAG: glycosyltransferase family 4 protein, partial [Deltaproteobacteria bacterium]|nr:glycosyltransferase family 4 protein [Deltaproteobacteria bacterium]
MRIWQCTGLSINGVGGVERHVAEVSAGLKRLGHSVHVGRALPDGWLAQATTADPIVLHTHGDAWPNPRLLVSRTRRQLLWVHVCHGTSAGRVIACREFTSISGWRGSVSDFFPTRFADAAVAVGQRALDEARTYFLMKLPAAVIPNGADPSIFAPIKQVEATPRLIFVGRGDDRVKNVAALLAACAQTRSDVPELQLWCAPGIDYDYTVQPFVKNLGALNSKELARAMEQSRALVLCSLYEGDPIVLHEAQGLGIPVVVSDIPQIRASLRGYANAIYVNPRNVDSIAFGLRN